MATPAIAPTALFLDEKFTKSSPGKIGGLAFIAMLIGGIIYITWQIFGAFTRISGAYGTTGAKPQPSRAG